MLIGKFYVDKLCLLDRIVVIIYRLNLLNMKFKCLSV